MEFDRALAFFREQQQDREDQSASVEEIASEEKTAVPRSSGHSLWLVLTALLLIVAGLVGLREWQHQQETKRQLQVAQWEAEAADHITKRRWHEALAVYQEIETLQRDSRVAVKGRRSIEAGMLGEQEQFLGYWVGMAISAVEARQWADAEGAMAKVFEVQPHHVEMKALAKKVRLMQSEGVRKQWKDQAQAAMDQRDWVVALPWIGKMLEAEPELEMAMAWKVTAEQGLIIEQENQRQAAELFQQAVVLDKGIYNPQLLDRISRAKKLFPQDSKIAALYQKVASYGRTIHVPQEFSELQKALDSARDNDRIVIEPGTYEGPFAVGVAVILEAASGQVILSCPAEDGPALTIRKSAQGAKISGIQFQHSTMLTDVERYSAVLIVGAKVALDFCRFLRAAGHGMAVIQGGDVDIDQCRFEENGWNGISVQELASKAQIHNSVFLGNIDHGIEVWNQATAVLENNRCADNCLNGILIDTTAAVTVKSNQCTGNRDYGIVLRAGAGGEVSGNRLTENLLGGMAIAVTAKNVECKENNFGKNEGAALSLGKGLSAAPYSKNQFPDTLEKSVLLDLPME